MTSDEAIDILVGADRPESMERSNPSYAASAAKLVSERGRVADADAIHLLREGRSLYKLFEFAMPLGFAILMIVGELVIKDGMIGSAARIGVAIAMTGLFVVRATRYRRATARLRAIGYLP